MSAKKSMQVVDIFAGPGGLGEGFAAYEENGNHPFNLTLSVEKDPSAHSTLLMRSFYRQFSAADIIYNRSMLESLLSKADRAAKIEFYTREGDPAHKFGIYDDSQNDFSLHAIMHVIGEV